MATLPTSSVSALDKRFDEVEVRMAKVVKKSDDAFRRDIGQAIEYALSLSNRTQKELWVAMGHNDGAELNRWIAGEANPRVWQLFSVDWFRKQFVIALAGLVDEIQVETTLRMRL